MTEPAEPLTEERVNLVIVGDGAVGKTCLLATFATGNFPEEYVPTVFENTVIEVQHKGSPVLLQLWDTAGQEDYDRLRPLSYPGTNVALLCYSTVSEASYEAVTEKWYEEIITYIKDVPLVLVGTKCDMREDEIPDHVEESFEPISTESGEELAKEIEAKAFFETSSKTQYNLKEMFEKAIEIGLEHRRSLSPPAESQPSSSPENSSKRKSRSSGKRSSSSKRKSVESSDSKRKSTDKKKLNQSTEIKDKPAVDSSEKRKSKSKSSSRRESKKKTSPESQSDSANQPTSKSSSKSTKSKSDKHKHTTESVPQKNGESKSDEKKQKKKRWFGS